MNIVILENKVIVSRDEGDKRIKNESHLLFILKQNLNKLEKTKLIKKPMWKDGHMVAETQHYLRGSLNGKKVAIYDNMYAIRDSAKDYNNFNFVEFAILEWVY